MSNQQTATKKGRIARQETKKPKVQLQKVHPQTNKNKGLANTPVNLVNPATNVTVAPIAKEQPTKQMANTTSAQELLNAQFPIPAKNNFDVANFAPFAKEKPATKEEITTPKTPEEDPNFIALKQSVTTTAKRQSKHGSASNASQEAQKAAPSPSNERLSTAQATQVEVMEQQEAGEFSAKDFKEQLQARIAEMQLPKNEDEADDFENNNNINEVNNKALQDVNTSKDNASGAIATTTAAKPNVADVPTRKVQPLPTPKYGKSPFVSGAKKAMPPKRTNAEVEQPIQQQTDSIDNQMATHGVTDEMLANSNEASFTTALNEKNTAKAQSVAATEQFRNKEVADQQNLQNQAQQTTNSQVKGMHTTRKDGLQGVSGNQKATANKNSAARKQIADKVNSIYNATKDKVDTLLDGLDTEVATKFTKGAKHARIAFEAHVAIKMRDYKKKRYGDSFFDFRQLRRVGDALVGLPEEVNKFFVSGRKVYIDTMDVYITEIANIVAKKLNKAKSIIANGKTEVKNYVDGLSPELKKLGKEAASSIEAKFNSLEKTVDDKKDQLIEVLAEKYAENLASVDARIDELKAANEGLVNKALGALKGVFDFIIKVKNTLTNLLAKIVEVVVAIITDPIGFFKNLIAGVGQGFSNFGANIIKHLQTGFFGWLTGAMQGITFTMPENIFSLKGIFSIVMQVLGLTWQGIRTIGAKVIGEPVMKVIETGVQVVQIIRKDGIAGLWKYVKDQFQDLKAVVMDAIMNLIQTQVIQAGIKWIMGLLSPVGAFIKAAMAIVDVIKFFIERAAQIMELVNAFIDSVAAIASGKVGAVAKAIENALGKAIPVLIGLLASILGIGGLANKVMGLIRKIRQRITKAITKFWKKIKKGAKKLLRKFKKGGAKKIKEDNKKGKAEKITAKDKAKHKKIVANVQNKLEAEPKKEPKDFADFYKMKKQQAKQLEDKYQPQLKKGINIDITTDSLAKEEKDNDVDFKIKIQPNTTKKKATAKTKLNNGEINAQVLHNNTIKDYKGKKKATVTKKENKDRGNEIVGYKVKGDNKFGFSVGKSGGTNKYINAINDLNGKEKSAKIADDFKKLKGKTPKDRRTFLGKAEGQNNDEKIKIYNLVLDKAGLSSEKAILAKEVDDIMNPTDKEVSTYRDEMRKKVVAHYKGNLKGLDEEILHGDLTGKVGNKILGEIFEKWVNENTGDDIKILEVIFEEKDNSGKPVVVRKADGSTKGSLIEIKSVVGKPSPKHIEQMKGYRKVIDERVEGHDARDKTTKRTFTGIEYRFSNRDAAEKWKGAIEEIFLGLNPKIYVGTVLLSEIIPASNNQSLTEDNNI